MIKYGKIEDGLLRTKEIEATNEEQIAKLEKRGWKPLDEIDESELVCENGYKILAKPIEHEDHIGYEYVKMTDAAYYNYKIQELKNELASTDYKIIRCYEAYLIGEIMPYNALKIHSQRKAIRDQIYELEDMLDKS